MVQLVILNILCTSNWTQHMDGWMDEQMKFAPHPHEQNLLNLM